MRGEGNNLARLATLQQENPTKLINVVRLAWPQIKAALDRVGYGQRRLQVIWNRIIFPDASWVDLGGMLGQDAHGSAGFSHDVDNHYKRLIGFALLTSVFSTGFQLSQTQRTSVLQTPTPGEIAASAVGQEVSQLGMEITRRNLNVQPTIRAPIGYKFNVRATAISSSLLRMCPIPGARLPVDLNSSEKT